MNQIIYALIRVVKILLFIAIFLLFIRAIFYPSALDLIILLLLFVVFFTMFVGRPPV
ncbi:hypothetical protein LSG31_20305 [Fodinisporobacter ferrooxydans]|uniref:Uncharacterized protein n=1 Tax=Fodinisporobacter ferrooxydans TaxID=2901836 RepID=A0ABY4CI33_9BACL|nr:hypothetical protein LSG31_20305 [Alicyclobacillaceae bacterium MYW30-H2]